MAFTIWRRARLKALGIIVLLVGVGTGDLIFWLAGRDDKPSDADVLVDQMNSKVYQRDVERNVGKFGAFLADLTDSLAELGKPKPLALTIMIVSCVTAGGCFWAAARMRD